MIYIECGQTGSLCLGQYLNVLSIIRKINIHRFIYNTTSFWIINYEYQLLNLSQLVYMYIVICMVFSKGDRKSKSLETNSVCVCASETNFIFKF